MNKRPRLPPWANSREVLWLGDGFVENITAAGADAAVELGAGAHETVAEGVEVEAEGAGELLVVLDFLAAGGLVVDVEEGSLVLAHVAHAFFYGLEEELAAGVVVAGR
jgi:hypothetical protein